MSSFVPCFLPVLLPLIIISPLSPSPPSFSPLGANVGVPISHRDNWRDHRASVASSGCGTKSPGTSDLQPPKPPRQAAVWVHTIRNPFLRAIPKGTGDLGEERALFGGGAPSTRVLHPKSPWTKQGAEIWSMGLVFPHSCVKMWEESQRFSAGQNSLHVSSIPILLKQVFCQYKT